MRDAQGGLGLGVEAAGVRFVLIPRNRLAILRWVRGRREKPEVHRGELAARVGSVLIAVDEPAPDPLLFGRARSNQESADHSPPAEGHSGAGRDRLSEASAIDEPTLRSQLMGASLCSIAASPDAGSTPLGSDAGP